MEIAHLLTSCDLFIKDPNLHLCMHLNSSNLAYDISWDEVVFMSQFQFRLHSDMKDLLLTMSDPTALS
jgi:hypothetical protein